MIKLHRRLLTGGVTTALAAAALVTMTSTAPASAESKAVTVPAKPGQASVDWQGTAPFNNGNSGLVWGQLGVDDPTGACDPDQTELNSQQQVEVSFPDIPKRYETLVRFSVSWTDDAGGNTTNDLAMYLFGPDGKLVAAADGSQNLEGINVTSRVPGTYNVLVCAFQNPPTGTVYTGKATAYTIKPGKVAESDAKAPRYHQYSAPAGVADYAGEPSIGSNWKTGNTLFTANTDEYVVNFNDKAKTSKWELVNDDVVDPSNKISLDPIGWTDHLTGRTIVSQLYLACSATAYSDDDFDSPAIPSEGCGTGINGFDHQTIGGGPYPKSVPKGSYRHAVYYCSQGGALLLGKAYCSRSDDGGQTFGAPVALWNTECSGIHGHVQVGPDGAVYVPNAVCGDQQGVAVSRDAGQTWKVQKIPGSIAGQSDPYVAVGLDNTLYVAYADGTGEARVAISRDHGATWTRNLNVGSLAGIRNTEFAMVQSGNGKRAAVAFLGTRTPGSTQAADFGKSKDGETYTGGKWNLYIATTYDRGASWKMVNATRGDPVQRGCIWNSGGSNPCRNLLDFNGITLDKTGRVMAGFADGCVGPDIDASSNCIKSDKVSDNGLVDHGAIVRQIGGKRLYPKPHHHHHR